MSTRLENDMDDFVVHFTSSEELVYLNTAAQGRLPDVAILAMQEYCEQLRAGYTEVELRGFTEELRTRLALFLAASRDEIAFTKNISDGLNQLIRGFPWQPGDHVLVVPELEHPTLLFILGSLTAQHVLIEEVACAGRMYSPDALIQRIDDNTRMIVVSHVSYLSGSVMDLMALGNVCRERNIFLLVDAAQSVGVRSLSLCDLPIDALVGNTRKGLLGIGGLGFLYCRYQWLDQIRPSAVGMENVKSVEKDAWKRPNSWEWEPSARRFETGHTNSLAAAVALASIKLLQDTGIHRIEAQVAGLREDLIIGLKKLNIPICSSSESSHIIACVPPKGMTAELAVEQLRRFGVVSAPRQGSVRLSLHGYNTLQDVDRALGAIERLGYEEA